MSSALVSRAVIAAVVFICAVSAAAADLRLSPVWKAGEETVFTYTSDATTKNAIPAARALNEQRTRQEMRIRQRVVQTGEQGTTLELVFERIKAVITQGRMFMLYDSDKHDPERSNVLEDAIRPMIGVPIRVELGADNAVKSVSGFPEPRIVDGNVRPLIVDEELVRHSLAPLYGLRRPAERVRAGEGWTDEEQLPGGTNNLLHIRHRRTVDAADTDRAQISSTATADLRPVEPGKHSKLLLVGFDCTTKYEWDVKQSRLGWMVLEQRTETHGEVKQARSENVTTVRMTLASEGHTPPAPPTGATGESSPPGAAPSSAGGSPTPASR